MLWLDAHDCIGKLVVAIVLGAQSCPILGGPMTVAHKAPLSMGFSRQVYWSGFLIGKVDRFKNIYIYIYILWAKKYVYIYIHTHTQYNVLCVTFKL